MSKCFEVQEITWLSVVGMNNSLQQSIVQMIQTTIIYQIRIGNWDR